MKDAVITGIGIAIGFAIVHCVLGVLSKGAGNGA